MVSLAGSLIGIFVQGTSWLAGWSRRRDNQFAAKVRPENALRGAIVAVGWLAGRLASWLAGWLASCMADWLAGWPAG